MRNLTLLQLGFLIILITHFVEVSTESSSTVNCVPSPSNHRHLKNPMRKWPNLDKIRRSGRTTADETQAQTVREMLARLLLTNRSDILVVVNSSLVENGRDVFVLESDIKKNILVVTGSSGVAAAWGFHYFAKTFCNCHFSWSGNQIQTLPQQLPVLQNPIKIVANDIFRYYQNVCTASYSSVWWNWTRWEQEIDWMALNSINLPLAFTGQEEIFRRVLLSLGFVQSDLDDFFTGPAFLTWNRMGNVNGWGGPLPQNWYDQQLHLQHKILNRMRDFGMVPVLPAFSGHVPSSILKYFPNAIVTQLSDWRNFSATYCCTYLLDYRDPLYQVIGTSFMSELRSEFGLDHVYNCDIFNEMPPLAASDEYVAGVGQATFQSMVTIDPDAVWLMQGWLFQEPFWNVTMAQALLTSVPIGRMIVLDLQAELNPQYERLQSFFGQPWIWCMLHNFGAVKGIYGAVDKINQGPFRARSFPHSTMIGTGITPEGIEQNDVVYELMNEMAFLRTPVDPNTWFAAFARRRYGTENADVSESWTILSQTALNCNQQVNFHGHFVLTRRPSLHLQSILCYDPEDFLPAWDKFVSVSENGILRNSALFQHDLVDVTREALVIYTEVVYSAMVRSFDDRNEDSFNDTSNTFLRLLADLELLLTSDVHFLLGTWLEAAKALANDINESSLYEYNARNQITLWGPTGEILDYANKQWSGMLSSYYIPRWQLFVQTALINLRSNTTFNESRFNRDVLEQVEIPFTLDKTVFPTTPTSDPIKISKQLHSKWRSQFTNV